MEEIHIHDIDAAYGDADTLHFGVVTPDGTRVAMALPMSLVGHVVLYFLNVAHEDAGFEGTPTRPDASQAIPLPNAKAWIQGVQGDQMGAVLLDFGVAKFAVPCSAAELRQMIADATAILDNIGAKRPN